MKTLIFILFFIIPFNVNSNDNISNFLQKYKWISQDKGESYFILEFKNNKVIKNFYILKELIDKEEYSIVKKYFKNNQLFLLLRFINKIDDKTESYEIYHYFWGISKLSSKEIVIFSSDFPKNNEEPYKEIFEIYN